MCVLGINSEHALMTANSPSNSPDISQPALANDLIVGAAAIAAETGLTERQVFYFASRGQIPVRKMGRLLTASRRRLRAHFAGEQ
jgi:hypothetical protein